MMPSPAKKHILQKVSRVFVYLCALGVLVCMGWLLMYRETLDTVYRASLGASAFFFFSVGIVLHVMASANLPDLSTPKK